MAAFIVVVSGARAASVVIVPLLLSIFLAFVCSIPQGWLIKKKVPPLLATVLVVIGFIAIFSLLGWLVGSSVDDFVKAAPSYQARLKEETGNGVKWLQNKGINISGKIFVDYFDPSSAMTVASKVLSSITGALTNMLLVLIMMIFILLEVTPISEKLRNLQLKGDKTGEYFSQITAGLYQFIILKTAISLLTAVLLWGWLTYLGVSYANLWGVFVFFLNFVPNIGSIIAGILPFFVALVEGGPSVAIAVVTGFVFMNLIIGNVLEPRYMGSGLGLSTLVVFLSLAFWAWVFGPVGMLLSVPLTLVCKIAFESSEDLWWVAVLMGDNSPGK
jgi:predicted PurR-regulated permease PerM